MTDQQRRRIVVTNKISRQPLKLQGRKGGISQLSLLPGISVMATPSFDLSFWEISGVISVFVLVTIYGIMSSVVSGVPTVIQTVFIAMLLYISV